MSVQSLAEFMAGHEDIQLELRLWVPGEADFDGEPTKKCISRLRVFGKPDAESNAELIGYALKFLTEKRPSALVYETGTKL